MIVCKKKGNHILFVCFRCNVDSALLFLFISLTVPGWGEVEERMSSSKS